MKFAGSVAITAIFLMFVAEIIPYIEYFEVPQYFGIHYSENTSFFLLGFGLFLRILSIFGLLIFFIQYYQKRIDKK